MIELFELSMSHVEVMEYPLPPFLIHLTGTLKRINVLKWLLGML